MEKEKKTKNKYENMTFEQAYDMLEQAANSIMNDDITLKQAIECYRQGRIYYDACSKMLNEADQLIKKYDKETGAIEEFKEYE
jgi:exodeoxyribonuclease VII small subunit